MADNKKSGFRGGDAAINRSGRPRGRRNKVSPEQEYEKAFNAGMSYSEIIDMLSAKIRNADKNKLSENELIKYIGKLLDVKKDVAKEYLQILKDAESKQEETNKTTQDNKPSVGSPVVEFKTKAN